MDKTSNTLETFLTKEQLKEYRSKEYPFNTNFLGQILKEKLKEDPEYEVWVPFFYCRYSLTRKDRNAPSITHGFCMFISNKGKLVRCKAGEYIPLPIHVLTVGYSACKIPIGAKEWMGVMMHRALASVFLPLPPELKLWHPKDLQVNHIDGIKTNFELDNLEWVTDLGNKTHAVETGLIKTGKESVFTKPVRGKVEFGPYTGHEFILHGQGEYKKHGFIQSNIVACCKGRVKRHRNCSWAYATESELTKFPHGLSEDIRKSLNGRTKRTRRRNMHYQSE